MLSCSAPWTSRRNAGTWVPSRRNWSETLCAENQRLTQTCRRCWAFIRYDDSLTLSCLQHQRVTDGRRLQLVSGSDRSFFLFLLCKIIEKTVRTQVKSFLQHCNHHWCCYLEPAVPFPSCRSCRLRHLLDISSCRIFCVRRCRPWNKNQQRKGWSNWRFQIFQIYDREMSKTDGVSCFSLWLDN